MSLLLQSQPPPPSDTNPRGVGGSSRGLGAHTQVESSHGRSPLGRVCSERVPCVPAAGPGRDGGETGLWLSSVGGRTPLGIRSQPGLHFRFWPLGPEGVGRGRTFSSGRHGLCCSPAPPGVAEALAQLTGDKTPRPDAETQGVSPTGRAWSARSPGEPSRTFWASRSLLCRGRAEGLVASWRRWGRIEGGPEPTGHPPGVPAKLLAPVLSGGSLWPRPERPEVPDAESDSASTPHPPGRPPHLHTHRGSGVRISSASSRAVFLPGERAARRRRAPGLGAPRPGCSCHGGAVS